jgi:hypothetical protein
MPDHDCEKGDQLQRIEDKLDAFLDRLSHLESRVTGHELVAGGVLGVGGLVVAIVAIVK